MLSACGFQFGQQMTAPARLNPVAYHSNKPYSYVNLHLRDDLEASGVVFAQPGNKSAYTMDVSNINMTQQVTGSSTAITQVNQYSIYLSLDFALQSKRGKTIVPKRRITSSRIITVNANQILGTDNATRVVRDEMIRDISGQIIRQLASSNVKHRL